MPRFRHDPLASSDREIRLLSVEQGDSPEDIRCFLYAASLDNPPPYIAVSYEWGEPEPLVDIEIDWKWFSVRHNLFLLLQYLSSYHSLRNQYPPCRFWVDAICIDQENTSEKGSQVQNMGRVFRQADHVITWLGWPRDWDPDQAFQFIEHLAEPQSLFTRLKIDPKYFVLKNSHLVSFDPDAILKSLIHWKMVQKLCECSYWSRRWIVQEVILAQDLKITCGRDELKWDKLEKLFQIASDLSNANLFSVIGKTLHDVLSSIPYQIWKHRSTQRDPGSAVATMPELLSAYQRTKCALLHDRVFSLVALATGTPLRVDYSMSVVELLGHILDDEDEGKTPSEATSHSVASTLEIKHIVDYRKKPKSDTSVLTSHVQFPAVIRARVLGAGPIDRIDHYQLGRFMPYEQRVIPNPFPNSKSLHFGSSEVVLRSTGDIDDLRAICRDFRRPLKYDELSSNLVFACYILCDDGTIGSASDDVETGDLVCKYDYDKYLLLRLDPEDEATLRVVGLADIWTRPKDLDLEALALDRTLTQVVSTPVGPRFDFRWECIHLQETSGPVSQWASLAKDFVELPDPAIVRSILLPSPADLFFDISEFMPLLRSIFESPYSSGNVKEITLRSAYLYFISSIASGNKSYSEKSANIVDCS